MPRKLIDLTGQRFGRLVVLHRGPNGPHGSTWHCRCDCGQLTNVANESLRSGNTRSCGCLHAERQREAPTIHGKAETRVWIAWRNMRQRCSNPKRSDYANYGGRGIRVCERWTRFETFYADMGEPPEGMSLDRKDVNGDYSPENCRWATKATQARNTRATRLITFMGVDRPLVDWCTALGLPYRETHTRLRRGWTVERAFTEPFVRASG